MKKNMLFLMTLHLLLSLTCCTQNNKYQDATQFDMSDFDVKKLIGSTFLSDSLIMKPSQLQVYDTLLITCNSGTDKLFHIFNLKTKQKIAERIKAGQGPTEMLLPFFVAQKDSIKIFDMMTATLFTYSITEFITNPDPIPTNKTKLSIQPLWSELAKVDDNLVATTNQPEAPCYLFNNNGEKISNFGSYPISKITYTDAELINAYRSILVSNQTDKIAICHFFTDAIDIYNKNGKLENRLHGPDHFFPYFKEEHHDNIITSKAVKGTYRDAFYSPVNVDENFFVLYNGKWVEEEGYDLLAKQIFVFGWDGSPQQAFLLDQGVLRIDVDKKNKKIYGISDKPDYHIVEFSY